MLQSKLIIEIGVSKGLSIIDFLKGYRPPGYKNSGLQWTRIKSSSAKSRQVFKLQIYLSTDEVFKSWIAIMAGFLLWLSITSVMIEVFKVALAQRLLFYQYDLFYNGRNSPESLQAYDPALGGYIVQIKITTNIQVPCHCQHAPWHLGANAKPLFCSPLLKTRLITS